LSKRFAASNACIIYQDVDSAELVFDLGPGVLDLGFLAQVAEEEILVFLPHLNLVNDY
jgi:hypothetical protein